MKKSTQVTLTLVAAMGLAGCGRRLDPCDSATFNEQACQAAVNGGGYWWNGSWVPMRYSHPYPYYYDSYRGFVSRGGVVNAAPGRTYGRPSGSSHSPSVSRGGFGSIGGGHGIGG